MIKLPVLEETAIYFRERRNRTPVLVIPRDVITSMEVVESEYDLVGSNKVGAYYVRSSRSVWMATGTIIRRLCCVG